MKLPEDTHLAYIVSHETWYWRNLGNDDNPHVTIMASAKGSGGGVAWAFEIKEFELGGHQVTRAKIFDDAYAAFADVPELFAALADGMAGTLVSIREVLDDLGAVDETERKEEAR